MRNPLKSDPLFRQAVNDLRETVRRFDSRLPELVRGLIPTIPEQRGWFIADRIHRLTPRGWTVEEVHKQEDPSHDDR